MDIPQRNATSRSPVDAIEKPVGMILDGRIPLYVGRRSATMRPPLPAGCFQDAEGKVPVTAVEQPVGLVLP